MDQGTCFDCRAKAAKWSGYCEGCYLAAFGDPPDDKCDHGNDPNHVPCEGCASPKHEGTCLQAVRCSMWECGYQEGAAVMAGIIALGTWAAEYGRLQRDSSFGRCGTCGALRTGISLQFVVDGTGVCGLCRIRGLSYPADRVRE